MLQAITLFKRERVREGDGGGGAIEGAQDSGHKTEWDGFARLGGRAAVS